MCQYLPGIVAPVQQHVRCDSCAVLKEQFVFNGVCVVDRENYDSKFINCL